MIVISPEGSRRPMASAAARPAALLPKIKYRMALPHLGGEAPPPQGGELLGLGPDQGLGGAGGHTGRALPVVAQVALDAEPLACLLGAGDDPVGAGHDTGPAADTLVLMPPHRPPLVPPQGPREAGIHTGGIITMATEHREDPAIGLLHEEAPLGRRGLHERGVEVLGPGVLHGAGQLAGMTARTAVQPDKDILHRPS